MPPFALALHAPPERNIRLRERRAFFVGRAHERGGRRKKRGGLLPAFFKVIISLGQQNAPPGHQTSHACHTRNYNVNSIRRNK